MEHQLFQAFEPTRLGQNQMLKMLVDPEERRGGKHSGTLQQPLAVLLNMIYRNRDGDRDTKRSQL